MKQKLFGLLLVLLFSYWAAAPLLSRGFFPMHDDTQIARVVAMGKALRNGQFPVRWVSDLGYGYGYPIYNFYGPLPYYIGGALHAFGASGLVATKVMFAIGIVGAGVAMYLALASFLGIPAAAAAALFYVYAPYHAVQIYVRGAVGEFYALLFLPLIVAAIVKIYEGNKSAGAVLGGIGLAGVILSHTIMGYMTTVLVCVGIVGAGIVAKARRKSYPWGALLRLVLVGLSLSAFFWLPALMEMGVTRVSGQVGGGANLYDNFVCASQLWSSLWGWGGSVPGCVDGMSFMVGKLHIVAATAAFVSWVIAKKRDSIVFVGIAAFATVASVFLMLPVSAPVWGMIPKAEFVQYPWRLLIYTMLGTSLFVGLGVHAQKKMIGYVFAVAAVAGLLVLYPKRFVPQYTIDKPASDFENLEDIRFRVSKISDEYTTPAMRVPASAHDLPKGAIRANEAVGELELEIDTETYKKYFVTLTNPTSVTLNLMDFPGWKYWVNSVLVTPIVDSGAPSIMMPKGRSALEARFTNTWPRTIGNLVSIAAFLSIVYFYGKPKQKNHA